MGKVTRFEDLKCWQLARQLVKLVFDACGEGVLAKDFETKAQLKRAAMSTMNNVAEGFGRFSNKEFIRFLDIAQSSSIEVKSMTYTLEDMKYLTTDKIMEIRDKAEETKNSIPAFIRYLKKREDKLEVQCLHSLTH